jgi:hypothetical protein
VAAGAVCARLSLRPLFKRGPTDLQNPGKLAPRERGCLSFRGDAQHRTRNLEIPGLVLRTIPE